ncbi:MAG: HPr family phosphocarrier protein [Gemmataceae bacterium]
MSGEPIRHSLTITNPQGLHMRPLAALVEAANRFQSTISVHKDGCDPANGKSLMSLLGLAAEYGTVLIFEVTGPDAADALKAVLEAVEKTKEE